MEAKECNQCDSPYLRANVDRTPTISKDGRQLFAVGAELHGELSVYDKNAEEGEAEVIIAKQRNGPTGTVPLTFIPEYTRFENRAEDEVSFGPELEEA